MTSLTKACRARRILLFDYWMVTKRAYKLTREAPFSKDLHEALGLLEELEEAAPEGPIKVAATRDLIRLADLLSKALRREERKRG